MAVTRAQVANVEALAAWMQTNAVPNIFKSVTFSSGVLTATDADDNTVLEIHGGTGAGNSAFFRAYRAAGNYINLSGNRLPTSGNIQIICCDNGFIIDSSMTDGVGYERRFAALFSVTNNNKPAIVFPAALSATANAQYVTGLNHVAFGDSTTKATTKTFTPEDTNQTELVPFLTNADLLTVSYCPNAFYIPSGQFYSAGMGLFEMEESEYITNGYWAIKV